MKRTTIAPAFLLVGVLLIGGLSACTKSNASEASQPETTAANPVTSGQPKATDAERAQKREEIRKQVAAVLTPDEQQQLETKVKGGEKMRQALSELNLTTEQKTKIKDILKTGYQGGQKQSEKSSQ